MKKILSIILLTALLLLTFVSCGNKDTDSEIRIGYLTGPTGMGMAKLIHDNANSDVYKFVKYEKPTLAAADLLAGNLDVICMPTNDAMKNYNQTNQNSQVLAINCLSSLFILTDKNTTISSLEELEGKTIYTVQSGTPSIIISHILEESHINATVSTTYGGNVIQTPENLKSLIISGDVEIALAPEPVVTAAMLAIASNGNSDISYSVDLKVEDLWSEVADVPLAMGCVVGNKTFIQNNPNLINKFLEEYEDSIDYIANPNNIDTAAQYVVEANVMAAVPAARKALTNLGDQIDFVSGDDMKSTLVEMYNAIGISVIGGKIPDDEFFYDD